MLDAARHVFANVAFYRRLYRREPEALGDIPYVECSDFAAVRGPTDCMLDLHLMVGAIPTHDRASFVFRSPLSRARPNGSRDGAVASALALGIDVARDRPRFLLLADDATGPFAADLSALLAWDRAQASIAYLDGGATGLVKPSKHGGRMSRWSLCRRCRQAIGRIARCAVVCQAADPLCRSADCDRLLIDDACHLLGAARRGAQAFAFDGEDLIVEMEPSTGRPAVTTARPRCFPLVRYLLDANVRFAPEGDLRRHRHSGCIAMRVAT